MGLRHHVIISGTGRAGTTFLVQLLTRLGLDTGFAGREHRIDARANAGLELDIVRHDAPYIIKSPWLTQTLAKTLTAGGIMIDHAIIPVRDFQAAANSRIRVGSLARTDGQKASAPGGLWLTEQPEHQLPILYREFSTLLETLARHDVPVTLLWYPRLTRDADYLFGKLRFLMPAIGSEAFAAAFAETVHPERVHQLSAADA